MGGCVLQADGLKAFAHSGIIPPERNLLQASHQVIHRCIGRSMDQEDAREHGVAFAVQAGIDQMREADVVVGREEEDEDRAVA